MDNYIDSEPYIMAIRRLAASYQQGETYIIVKAKVLTVIESYKKRLGKKSETQVRGWSDFFDRLGDYLNNIAAPEWTSVIRYARKIINLKKHTAISSMKRLSESDANPLNSDKV